MIHHDVFKRSCPEDDHDAEKPLTNDLLASKTKDSSPSTKRTRFETLIHTLLIHTFVLKN